MRPKAAKHVVVAEHIRALVRQQKVKVGETIPTEHALCAELGCSRGTVRRALVTLEQEGLIRPRHGSGHYVNKPASSSRQMLLGLIVPNILNAEILRLAQMFTLEAGRKGYGIVLSMTSDQPHVEQEFVREMRRLKATGVIKFPTLPEVEGFESDIRARLRASGMPYVIINDFWCDTSRDHHMALDEAAAVEMAVEHLAGLGHRRIGWVDGSDGPRKAARQRFEEAMARRHFPVPESHFLMCTPYETPTIERMWASGAKGPTAIITPYDGIAIPLIEALGRSGRKVPGQVSVVSLNGRPFYATPGLDLTATLPPYDRIVQKALEVLVESDKQLGVCHCLFTPTFYVGRTSAGVA